MSNLITSPDQLPLVCYKNHLAEALNRSERTIERLRGLGHQLPVTSSTQGLGREGALLWDRLVRVYAELGDGFDRLPRSGLGAFRNKDLSHLVTALIYYCHMVRVLRSWRVWDPELARATEPVW